jgi:plastocyanin
MRKELFIPGVAALLLAGAAACSSTAGSGSTSGYGSTGGSSSSSASGGAPASSAPAQSGSAITIASFAFTTPLTVTAGSTVSVTNSDSANHTVTSDDGSSFDTPAPAGQTVTFKAPTKPGTYQYHCTIHPSMHGTLIVK